MARSTYIYLIREFGPTYNDNRLVAAFTVKHEAVTWAMRNGWGPENANLYRMHDGIYANKDEIEVPWPTPENRNQPNHGEPI